MQRIRQAFNCRPAMTWMASIGLALLLAVLLATPAPTLAQNADLQTLTQRIERLQRDLRTLEKDYYRGQKRGAPKQDVAGSAGAGSDPGQLANAEIRMSNLESEMRGLTGQLEEVRHGIQTMLQRLDGLVNDVEFRLTEIERRLTNAPQSGAKASDATDETEDGKAPGMAPAVGKQRDAEPSAPLPALPKGSVMERYNYAYSLLLKMRLDEAEAAFKEFLAQHGDDALAGNAQYWLGETYYTRSKLTEAAQTFLFGLERYPNSRKAPASMLKLGITLQKMGQKEEACATYLEMQKLYPNLQANVRKRMQQEMKAGGCS
jgi:tol-pal system protein YbgF